MQDALVKVAWGFQDSFHLHCEFDVTWFPFDKNICALYLSTSVSTVEQLLFIQNGCADMSHFNYDDEFWVEGGPCDVKV